jgi:predicted transcriptional regulator
MKHIKSLDKIAASLVKARKQRQLTQAELGKRLSLPQSYVSRLEGCRIDSRISTIAEIARYLGLEIMLVPASMVPTVNALLGQGSQKSGRPLYRLDDAEGEVAADEG